MRELRRGTPSRRGLAARLPRLSLYEWKHWYCSIDRQLPHHYTCANLQQCDLAVNYNGSTSQLSHRGLLVGLLLTF